MSAILLAILIALQLTDLWTTYIIVGRQGGAEQKPIMAGLISRFGVLPGLLIGKGAGIALFIAADQGVRFAVRLIGDHWLAVVVQALEIAVLAAAIAYYVRIVRHNRGEMR